MNLLSLWTRQVIQYTVVVESHNYLFLQWLCEKCLGGSMPLRVQLDALGALFFCAMFMTIKSPAHQLVVKKLYFIKPLRLIRIYIAIAKS